jgi:carbamoyl-phosphate synthase large subunit
MTTVLLTCAGQRADVAAAFRAAGATVVATDLDPLAPALYHADRRVLVPRIADDGYIPALASLVADHDVRLVVPLTDLDQVVLAERREALAPALVLLPPPGVVAVTRDKYAAHRFFVEHGIDSPPTWLPAEVPEDARFPVLVKPRLGFGSRDIYRCHDRDELSFFLRYTTADSMVQQVCDGVEFSIDVMCDTHGRCLAAVPRTMVQSKGGESIKGTSIHDDRLIEVGRRVAEALGIAGPANIQCFRTPDGRHEITDVNVRFGGGFPVHWASGAGFCELALALARGERPEPQLGAFTAGVTMTRFFWQVCLAPDAEGQLEPLGDGRPLAEAALPDDPLA